MSLSLFKLMLARGVPPSPTPTPGGPINVVPPSISGSAIDGTNLIFRAGEWTGTVEGFDIEVLTVEATPVVLLARQPVTADTTGAISAVGKSIKLNVWAKNGAAETLAESGAFGPIAPAGDTFVLGVAFATGVQSLPSSPYPFTGIVGPNTLAAVVNHQGTEIDASAIYPVANPNVGMTGLSFGFDGSSDKLGTATISANAFSDESRMKGRLGSNLSASQSHFRADLPGAGTYRIYVGLGHSGSNAATNFGIWEGPGFAISLWQMGPVNDGDTSTSVVDATGIVAPVATWASGAGPGMGNYKEITVGAAATISIGRSSGGGAAGTQLNSIAVFKVV